MRHLCERDSFEDLKLLCDNLKTLTEDPDAPTILLADLSFPEKADTLANNFSDPLCWVAVEDFFLVNL